ncbi:MAG TPA: hypothetical protein VMU17_04280 [Elusimicrobiota bacterium]|nr:hypothetical protein [Elusimicrobiota bacterium]
MNARQKTFLILFVAAASAYGMGRRPQGTSPIPLAAEKSDAIDYRMIEDDQGGFYALWSHEASTDTFSVYGQHIDTAGGATWDKPGIPLAHGIPDDISWDGFADGKGGFIVTWNEDGAIKAQRFGANGKGKWDENLRINTSSSPVSRPVGIADADSGAFIIWPEKRYSERWVLVAQHVNGSGIDIWNPDGQRISLYPSNQRDPRVVYDGASGAVVAWRETRDRAVRVQAQRLDYQGNLLWGQEGALVTTPAGAAADFTRIEPLGRGMTVTAWLTSMSGVSRLMLQGISAEGHPLWDPRGLQFSPGGWDEWNPFLLAAGDGTAWAGWEDHRNLEHWQIYVGAADRQGQPLFESNDFALAPSRSDQGRIALAEDGRHGLFGVWLDNRLGDDALFMQRIDDQGHRRLGESGRLLVRNLRKPQPPKMITLAPGRAAVLWADAINPGEWGLYWVLAGG